MLSCMVYTTISIWRVTKLNISYWLLGADISWRHRLCSKKKNIQFSSGSPWVRANIAQCNKHQLTLGEIRLRLYIAVFLALVNTSVWNNGAVHRIYFCGELNIPQVSWVCCIHSYKHQMVDFLKNMLLPLLSWLFKYSVVFFFNQVIFHSIFSYIRKKTSHL